MAERIVDFLGFPPTPIGFVPARTRAEYYSERRIPIAYPVRRSSVLPRVIRPSRGSVSRNYTVPEYGTPAYHNNAAESYELRPVFIERKHLPPPVGLEGLADETSLRFRPEKPLPPSAVDGVINDFNDRFPVGRSPSVWERLKFAFNAVKHVGKLAYPHVKNVVKDFVSENKYKLAGSALAFLAGKTYSWYKNRSKKKEEEMKGMQIIKGKGDYHFVRFKKAKRKYYRRRK